MQLSIIIVNYNVKYFLEQCLCSVMKAIEEMEAEVFVVDNNSTDGSKDFFTEKFHEVKFIWNNNNLGFAKANNIALKFATGNYILFLNPDTIVPEDCFEKCISFFESHPQAGALGIKMLDGSGKFLKESKRSFPSPLTSLYKLSGLTKLFPHSKIFARYHLGNLDADKNNEVDVLAGAFIMIPKKIITTVGSFDEEFFMYGEDIDLSYRIQKAGYKNFYFSESNIVHFKGESTKKGSINYVRFFYKAMSIFARKHYGSGKAGLFNFFIQVGILIRALISVTGKFLKWVGMPVIDAAVILMSFWVVKVFWNIYVKRDVNYSYNLLIIAFPVFTLIFLAASYYSGLYDNGYKQKRLTRSTAVAILILLSVYSLLPESIRFSRGILLFGSLMAFILMTVIRRIMLNWKIIENADEGSEHRQTVIIGTQNEFSKVHSLMQKAQVEERVLGRVEVNGIGEVKAIGNIKQLGDLLKTYPIKEVIFCEGKLSFKKIIELTASIPKNVRIKFHSSRSSGIIGSDSKDVAGKIVSHNKTMRLSQPINKRNKNLTDILICIFFILSFPLHFFLQKKPLIFFKKLFSVLFLKKTWVGYASQLKILPSLKPGVLTTTGVPAIFNNLPVESLESSDKWYAADYEIWQDIKIVLRGYKFLSA